MEDGAHDGIRQRRPDSLDPRANPHIDLDHDAILTDAPEDRFKLGYGTVIALILNRIIGKNSMDSACTSKLMLIYIRLGDFHQLWGDLPKYANCRSFFNGLASGRDICSRWHHRLH
jgi:hypothetical protein